MSDPAAFDTSVLFDFPISSWEDPDSDWGRLRGRSRAVVLSLRRRTAHSRLPDSAEIDDKQFKEMLEVAMTFDG